MSDDEPKSLHDLAVEILARLGPEIDEEIEVQFRAMHARGPIHPATVTVAFLALGQTMLRSLELAPGAAVAVQLAASLVSATMKMIPEERVAELTERERDVVRRLGGRIPKIGKA